MLVRAVLAADKPAKNKNLPMAPTARNDHDAVPGDILKKLQFMVGTDKDSVSTREAYQGVAWTVRERLIENFNKTQEYWRLVLCITCKQAVLHQLILWRA